MQPKRTWRYRAVLLTSPLSGVMVGLLIRFGFASSNSVMQNYSAFMTLAFIFVVPAVMGYWSVAEYLRTTAPNRIRWTVWIFIPWISTLITMLVCIAFQWEGLICILMATPIALVCSTIGGLLAVVVWSHIGPHTYDRLSALALPILLLAIESHIPNPLEIRSVETEILIHAPAATVWNNIKSVPLIRTDELPHSWLQTVGFPRPLAATLSHEGVGGVRQASFTGGLVFTETVNDWQQNSNLRFSIRANTDSIPPATLDEHAKIGGSYFDVLQGEYRIEQRPDGVLLHLTSQERISTHFNPYTGLWTDAVMKGIQQQILEVIRKRCEQPSAHS